MFSLIARLPRLERTLPPNPPSRRAANPAAGSPAAATAAARTRRACRPSWSSAPQRSAIAWTSEGRARAAAPIDSSRTTGRTDEPSATAIRSHASATSLQVRLGSPPTWSTTLATSSVTRSAASSHRAGRPSRPASRTSGGPREGCARPGGGRCWRCSVDIASFRSASSRGPVHGAAAVVARNRTTMVLHATQCNSRCMSTIVACTTSAMGFREPATFTIRRQRSRRRPENAVGGASSEDAGRRRSTRARGTSEAREPRGTCWRSPGPAQTGSRSSAPRSARWWSRDQPRVLERLATAGAAWRREQAAALQGEEVSIDPVAAMFGVTRLSICACSGEDREHAGRDQPVGRTSGGDLVDRLVDPPLLGDQPADCHGLREQPSCRASIMQRLPGPAGFIKSAKSRRQDRSCSSSPMRRQPHLGHPERAQGGVGQQLLQAVPP